LPAGGTAAWIAKVLFVVGLVVFLVLLATGRSRQPFETGVAQEGGLPPFFHGFSGASPTGDQKPLIKTIA